MRPLFSTTINMNGDALEYQVFFEAEAYHFRASGNQEIVLIRQHDEWHSTYSDKEAVLQAVTALDKYLLSQH